MGNYASTELDGIKHTIKCHREMFFELLNLQITKDTGIHLPCRFCNSSDAMRVGIDQSGERFFKCYSCGQKGDVITAYMLINNCDFKTTIKEISGKIGLTSRPAGLLNGTHSNGTIKKYVPKTLQLTGPVNAIAPTTIQAPVPYTNGYVRPQSIIPVASNRIVRAAPRKQVDPKIDFEAAEKFVIMAHEKLMANFDTIMQRYERGISSEVAKKYRIGFIDHEEVKFRPWHPKGMIIPKAWVIPCTGEEGEIKGVKIHCEEPPRSNDGKNLMAKCFWMPFGTEPKYDEKTDTKPVHAYYGMFPHPDTLTPQTKNDFSVSSLWWIQRIKECSPETQQRWNDTAFRMKWDKAYEIGKRMEELDPKEIEEALERAWYDLKHIVMKEISGEENRRLEEEMKKPRYLRKIEESEEDDSQIIRIVPGELKALATESLGYMATSPTGGETWMASPEWLSCFQGANVELLYDDEPPRRNPRTGQLSCPGIEWAGRWSEALIQYGAHQVSLRSLGKKQKSEDKIKEIEEKYKLLALANAEGEDF